MGIPKNTLYTWMRQNRLGNLYLGAGTQTSERALTLNEALYFLILLLNPLSELDEFLKEENEFLEEASAFFAASRRKSVKTRYPPKHEQCWWQMS